MIKATFFLLAVIAITGCSMVAQETDRKVKISEPQKIKEYKLNALKSIHISMRLESNANLEDIKRKLKKFDIYLKSPKNININKKYSGPEFLSGDGVTIMELILSNLYLDFEVEYTLNDKVFLRLKNTEIRSLIFKSSKLELREFIDSDLSYYSIKEKELYPLGIFELGENKVLNSFTTTSAWNRLVSKFGNSRYNSETLKGGVRIYKGTVNDNIRRIANIYFDIPEGNVEFKYLPCELVENYSYTIPSEKFKDKYSRLTFYASQYSFFTTFHPMTNTVTLEYRGPDVFDDCRKNK